MPQVSTGQPCQLDRDGKSLCSDRPCLFRTLTVSDNKPVHRPVHLPGSISQIGRLAERQRLYLLEQRLFLVERHARSGLYLREQGILEFSRGWLAVCLRLVEGQVSQNEPCCSYTASEVPSRLVLTSIICQSCANGLYCDGNSLKCTRDKNVGEACEGNKE